MGNKISNSNNISNANNTNNGTSSASISDVEKKSPPPLVSNGKNRKIFWIIISLVAALIIAAVIIVIILVKKDKNIDKATKLNNNITSEETKKSNQESNKLMQESDEEKNKKSGTLHSSFCGTSKLKMKPKTLNLTKLNNMDSTSSSSSSYGPISIGVDFNSFRQPSKMSSSIFSKIRKIILETANEFRKFLQIKHQNIPLIDSDKKVFLEGCNLNSIGSNFKNYLTLYDLIIFPTFDNLGDYTLAAAGACVFTGNSYKPRPVGGVLYINSKLNFEKTNTDLYMKSVLFHEMTHVLVFEPELMRALNIVKKEGSNYYISSSVVLNAIKKHFGCNSVTKFYLENQGGEGTLGAHWESRYMLGDYMVSTDYPGAVMSDITLALFDATGYYRTMPYSGGLFKFGKNKGCDFLEQKCIEDTKPISDEFCVLPDEPKCSYARNMKLSCYIIDYSNYGIKIPEKYQYFDNNYLGGFSYADYCPVALEESADDDYFNYSCNVGTSTLASEYGETIGYDSLCFMSSLLPSSSSKIETTGPICYKIKCNSKYKNYDVQIGSRSITCPTNGGSMSDPYFKGNILCQKYDDVCQSDNDVVCSEMFDCFTKLAKNDGYSYGVNNIEEYEEIIKCCEKGSKINYKFTNLLLLMIYILFIL